MATGNNWANQEMSFETAVQGIQEYFKHGEDIAFKMRQSKLEERLKAVYDFNPQKTAHKLLTEEGYSIIPQASVSDRSNYANTEIKTINSANLYPELEDCKYLNIIIPATEEHRQCEAISLTTRKYFSEQLDVKAREMALEKFMTDISQLINNGVAVPHEYVVVRERKELEQKIKVFVADNKDKYKKLFITLCCHGGESGTISMHDGEWTNNDYLKYLGRLADDPPIPIETLMGQCFSYNYDANILSMSLSVHITTTDEENKRGTVMQITAPFTRDDTGKIVQIDLFQSESQKVPVRVAAFIKEAECDAFSTFSRRLQAKQEQEAENQVIQNKASDQPGDAMVADGEAESMDYTEAN